MNYKLQVDKNKLSNSLILDSKLRNKSENFSDFLPNSKNVLAIIITYNPDSDLNSRVRSILAEVETVLIIDNKSISGTEELEKAHQIKGVFLIKNKDNLGVATALNQALACAYSFPKKTFRWILTFDQDTLVYPGMIKQYQKILTESEKPNKIAIIGTNYFCRSINDTRFHFSSKQNPNFDWLCIPTVITSGSLMNLKLTKLIGDFRDEFFIDHVDDEYCLRARKRGYQVIINKTALMEHTIGAESLHRFLWRQTGTSNHSPIRRYYMMRNHLYLVQEYLGVETKWVLNTVYSRLKMMILMLIYEDNRAVKLKHCLVGLQHGFKKILGKKN